MPICSLSLSHARPQNFLAKMAFFNKPLKRVKRVREDFKSSLVGKTNGQELLGRDSSFPTRLLTYFAFQIFSSCNNFTNTHKRYLNKFSLYFSIVSKLKSFIYNTIIICFQFRRKSQKEKNNLKKRKKKKRKEAEKCKANKSSRGSLGGCFPDQHHMHACFLMSNANFIICDLHAMPL